jgi:nicotinate-nucleotide adenylyltransferase
VALYGGSFNPPHLGHVLATAWALSASEAAQVWWIPVGEHAFEKSRFLAPFEHRLAMCQLAAAPLGSRVQVLDLEGRRAGVSRTIDTVRALNEQYPALRFRLLVGTDVVPQLPSWKEWPALQALAPPLVVGRAGYAAEGGGPPQFAIPNVSSSAVRQALVQGQLWVRDALPLAVAQYVQQHPSLYAEAPCP